MGLGIKTWAQWKWDELTGKHQSFGAGYHEWQAKRIRAILDHYGHEFFNSRVIAELGAGFGDIGGFFSMLGAKVICLEGRESHIVEMRKRYPAVLGIQHDCNNPLPARMQKGGIRDSFRSASIICETRPPSLRDVCSNAPMKWFWRLNAPILPIPISSARPLRKPTSRITHLMVLGAVPRRHSLNGFWLNKA